MPAGVTGLIGYTVYLLVSILLTESGSIALWVFAGASMVVLGMIGYTAVAAMFLVCMHWWNANTTVTVRADPRAGAEGIAGVRPAREQVQVHREVDVEEKGGPGVGEEHVRQGEEERKEKEEEEEEERKREIGWWEAGPGGGGENKENISNNSAACRLGCTFNNNQELLEAALLIEQERQREARMWPKSEGEKREGEGERVKAAVGEGDV